jgi:hypothetical protein
MGGGGAAATGCFFAAQPAKSRQRTIPAFLIFSVFALSRPLVDCQSWLQALDGLSNCRTPNAEAFECVLRAEVSVSLVWPDDSGDGARPWRGGYTRSVEHVEVFQSRTGVEQDDGIVWREETAG